MLEVFQKIGNEIVAGGFEKRRGGKRHRLGGDIERVNLVEVDSVVVKWVEAIVFVKRRGKFDCAAVAVEHTNAVEFAGAELSDALLCVHWEEAALVVVKEVADDVEGIFTPLSDTIGREVDELAVELNAFASLGGLTTKECVEKHAIAGLPEEFLESPRVAEHLRGVVEFLEVGVSANGSGLVIEDPCATVVHDGSVEAARPNDANGTNGTEEERKRFFDEESVFVAAELERFFLVEGVVALHHVNGKGRSAVIGEWSFFGGIETFKENLLTILFKLRHGQSAGEKIAVF